jgi:tryptophan halogenase
MQATEATQVDLDSSYDVFVLGGGPAGSTIAALLAERGWNVAIVEKEHHPRFHIGESLLPLNMPLLEHLGVYGEVKRIGMPKYGAEFNSPEHGPPVTFDFSRAWDKTYPSAFEVRRSEFDEILFATQRVRARTRSRAAASRRSSFLLAMICKSRPEPATASAVGAQSFLSMLPGAIRFSPIALALSAAIAKQRGHARPFHRRTAPPG